MTHPKSVVARGYDAIAATYLERFGRSAVRERWLAEMMAFCPVRPACWTSAAARTHPWHVNSLNTVPRRWHRLGEADRTRIIGYVLGGCRIGPSSLGVRVADLRRRDCANVDLDRAVRGAAGASRPPAHAGDRLRSFRAVGGVAVRGEPAGLGVHVARSHDGVVP